MATDFHKLIAAISPDVYCDPSVRKEVKQVLREKLYSKDKKERERAYQEAAKKAKLWKSPILFDYDEAKKDPLKKWGLQSPVEQHEIDYDSTSESLEPLYFWILDFLNNMFSGNVEKLEDTFVSSVGSGHFGELVQKATRMQEEAMKMMQTIGVIIKSVLNIVYDLKEFKIRLSIYDRLKSDNSEEKHAALLSLKQIWLDKVDIARGNTSVKALAVSGANAPNFVTLLDAFMAADSLKSIKDMDLNDRVKRILEQRIAEFQSWIGESEKELRKRYDIERRYLKNQVNSIKLYSQWVKPYFKSAQKLQQSEPGSNLQTALITTFNTIILELAIMAKRKYNPKDDVDVGLLPKVFEKATDREYFSIVIVEFTFRGIPQRISQRGDYSFGGKTLMKFTSYALNNQELEVFKKELEKSEFNDSLRIIEDATTGSLEVIKQDIDEFLEEDGKKKKEETYEEDVNPFTSLFSFFKVKKREDKKWDTSKPIKPDNEYERVIRSQAIIGARDSCFSIFDIYKRAHRMPAHLSPFDSMD